MNITLKQLLAFKTVASLGQVRLAAEQLHLSQPATSMALAELEKQLGCPLFDRTGNRLKLNYQGCRLLPMASELLERSTEITTAFLAPQQPLTGRLSLGASTTIGNYLLPETLAEFEFNHPNISATLTIHNTSTIIKKLLAFDIDMACIEGPCQHPDIITAPWLTDNLMILCAPDHPFTDTFTDKSPITLKQLEQCDWILREQGSGTRSLFDLHIGQHLRNPNIRMELNQAEAIKKMVQSGLGITCLSHLCVIKELERGELVNITPENINLSRQLWLITHRKKYHNNLLDTLIHQLMPATL